MATKDIEYDHEVVQAGEDSSPNNTIVEVADADDVSYKLYYTLNPHLLSTRRLRPGTKIKYCALVNGSNCIKEHIVADRNGDGSLDEDWRDTIHNYASNKFNTLPNVDLLHNTTEWLLENNKEELAKNVCFEAGDQILRSVGSMTNNINDFNIVVYTIPKEITINELVTNINNASLTRDQRYKLYGIERKVDQKDILSLNGSVEQNKPLPVNSMVIISLTAAGTGSTVTITKHGIMVGTTRTVYVKWDWDIESNSTENFLVQWSKQTIDGEWWDESEKTVNISEGKFSYEDSYNADVSAIAVKVKVKPVSKTDTKTKSEYEWSTEVETSFGYLALATPSAPNVEINNNRLTAFYENIESSMEGTTISHVEFQTIQNDSIIFDTQLVPMPKLNGTDDFSGYISYICNKKLDTGSRYKVRARFYSEIYKLYSSWSEYSGRTDILPVTPEIKSVEVLTDTDNAIELSWGKVESATTYEIEYVAVDKTIPHSTPQEYFTISNIDINTVSIESDPDKAGDIITHKIINIAMGAEYYIRMRAGNDSEISDWSEPKTFILGVKPTIPTTWSSSVKVFDGDTVKLYWTHNSEDGSTETWAEVEITTIINGVETVKVESVKKPTDKENRDKTSCYELVTSNYPEGAIIKWRVKTAGVYKENGNLVYSDYSMIRTINVYSKPELKIKLLDYNNEELGNKLVSLPLHVDVKIDGTSDNQKPTGYHISVISNESSTTVDGSGNTKSVVEGTAVYSKYLDISDTSHVETISGGDISLENNKTYHVVCTVSMSSGLIVTTNSLDFKVAWNSKTYIPNAEIGIDKETLTANIRPYCRGGDDIMLSVFRREFDGSFTELITEITNGRNTFFVDPHPALDYARYRVVARSKSNGAVSYNDIPGHLVGETGIVIQWDEAWQSFDVSEDGYKSEGRSWNGSMLKLPYNVKVSEQYNGDKALVNYIGRKHPVGYSGTQIGHTATWNTDIDKEDVETLHALRRLASWMGNVYVREPSGSGYWASITVSFSQQYSELIIPITLNITRVEGGV